MPGQCGSCMRFVPWDDMEGVCCLACAGKDYPYVADNGVIYGPQGGTFGHPIIGKILEPGKKSGAGKLISDSWS